MQLDNLRNPLVIGLIAGLALLAAWSQRDSEYLRPLLDKAQTSGRAIQSEIDKALLTPDVASPQPKVAEQTLHKCVSGSKVLYTTENCPKNHHEDDIRGELTVLPSGASSPVATEKK